MAGVGQLFPWNAYLSAGQYFAMEFDPFPYSFAMPIAFNWANIIVLFLMNFYGNKFTVQTRLQVGYFMMFAMLITVPAINLFPSISVNIRIAVCLAATFFSGFSTAVLIGTAFSAIATLPPTFTTALMAGQGLGGVMCAAIGMLLEFVVYPIPSPETTRMTGVLFFSAAAIVILVATILTEIMLRSPFYVFYLKKAEEGRNVQLSETESYPSSEDALLLGPGSNAEPTLKSVFKKIWPDAMSVFLVFIVTLSLFPGFTVMIPNFDPALGDKQLPNSTLPLVLVTIFQVGDLIGRFLPQLLVLIPKRFLLIPTVVRLGFYPLWMLMVYGSIFSNNIFPYVFMSIMALTNGYFSTLGMMNGPSRVNPREQQTAGQLMSFMLQFGIFVGVHLAMILLLIIEGPHAVIG